MNIKIELASSGAMTIHAELLGEAEWDAFKSWVAYEARWPRQGARIAPATPPTIYGEPRPQSDYDEPQF